MIRRIDPLNGNINPPLRIPSRQQGAGVMGGAAAIGAPSSAPKRRRAAPVAPTPPSAAATSAVPPLRPSRALIEHYLRYEGWAMRSIFTLDKTDTTGKRWEPSGSSYAVGHPYTITCYRDDERFERTALGALSNITTDGEVPAYRLGVLASVERLLGPRSPQPREAWDEGYDAATAAAVAALFLMARVDRAKWEAAR